MLRNKLALISPLLVVLVEVVVVVAVAVEPEAAAAVVAELPPIPIHVLIERQVVVKVS